MSYPRTGDNKGSGEVATGLRIKNSDLNGLRFTLGGSLPSHYEVFYDVYLKNFTGSVYNYEFRYWYRQVKLEQSPFGQNWVPVPNSTVKEIPIPQGPGVSTLDSIPGLGVSLPSLPLRGTSRPLTAIPTIPSLFGWTGTGNGTGPGSPGQGVGGGRPFPTRNPFGYSKPGDETTNAGGGRDGTSSGEDGSGNNADDDQYTNPGPPIPGFTTHDKRKTLWNPPPIRTITGAYVPVVYDWEGNQIRVDETESATRQSLLGYGTYAARMRKKAQLLQWIQIEDEWRATAGSATDQDGNTTDTWDDRTPLVPNGIRYGFRFMYNPAEIQFQMSPVPGLDPGVIISGLGRSFPMGDEDGGSIQLTTYLNRIEDMAFITSTDGGYRMTTGINPYGDRGLTEAQQKGIYTRGTGFDLEYLFRTTLGRPFPTKTRGITADIGLILGLPLLLNLGGRMSYTGRLTGLSYTHMYFTADMVPTFTAVSMSFTRFPDATRFNATPNPGDGGSGKNKPGKNNRPSEYGPPGARNP